MEKEVDVGLQFHHRLTNRDEFQTDGRYNARQFRKKYLSDLDSEEFWKNPTITVVLDFGKVKKIGPSFANEAFAYFTKYAKPDQILEVIQFKNWTSVQKEIIREELESGYRKKS